MGSPAAPGRHSLLGLAPPIWRLARMAVVAAVLAGSVIVGVPVIVGLRTHATSNAETMAWAVAGRLEGLGGDASAVALGRVAGDAGAGRITVHRPDGQITAEWQDPGATRFPWSSAGVAWLLGPGAATVSLPAAAGTVEVQADSRTALRVLLCGVLGVLACMSAGLLGARVLARRLLDLVGAEMERRHAGLLEETRRWRHQATHDSLTGLPNRAVFADRLDRALAWAERSGTRMAVVVMDCDDFKDVNDRHGHSAGDAVLVAVAGQARRALRDGDVLARLGGDEFAAILSPVGSVAEAVRMAEGIMAAGLRARGAAVSVSVGLAVYPDEATEATVLLHRADQAMYRAKRARNARRRTGPGHQARMRQQPGSRTDP